MARKRRVPKTLTRDEAKAVVEQPNTKTATGTRDRAMLLTMYRAGLRVGEVVGLKKTALQAGGRKLVIRGKGDKEREVALDGETRAALDLWLQHRARLVANGAPLFCGIKTAGQALTTRAVQKALRRYAVLALGEERGLQVTPHRFRHSHATELLNEGFTIREVQERLGHARLETTQLYTQVDNEALAAKINGRSATDGTPEPDTNADDLAAKIAALTPEQREALKALLG
jgi:integrase/recombinase XerC